MAMRYRVHGIGRNGKEKSGTITASNEEEAVAKAQRAGMEVYSVHPEPSEEPTLGSVSAEPRSVQRRPSTGLVISSGPICADYNVLGVVVGFASKAEGCSGSIAVEKVYQTAMQRLVESATAIKANGLIFINFQNRVASQVGCGSGKQVFEVFAWGTAISF